jgi:hypothetical protein
MIAHPGASPRPLTADTTEPAWNGDLLIVTCPCGVVFERWVTPEEAEVCSAGRRRIDSAHLLTTGRAQSSLARTVLTASGRAPEG